MELDQDKRTKCPDSGHQAQALIITDFMALLTRHCELGEAISVLSLGINGAIPLIRFDKSQKNAIVTAYNTGKLREKLSETTGGERSRPSGQKQMSLSRLCNDRPILSIPREWVF